MVTNIVWAKKGCLKKVHKLCQRSLRALEKGELTESSRLSFQNILHKSIDKMAAKQDKHEAKSQVWL